MENYIEINYENNMKMLQQAINYCCENLTHNDIMDVLKSNNDLKKQLCLIELNTINSQDEANILTFNLIGHSGPVRETASFKILDLISKKEYTHFFQTDNILNTFTKAITDINPTVSRNTVEIIKYINKPELLYKNILYEINETLKNLETIKQNRSYVQNKQNFNLYWNLEALISISDKIIPTQDLYEILKITMLSNDYTIREKTAKTAFVFKDKSKLFVEILESLKTDENIYVKKYTL